MARMDEDEFQAIVGGEIEDAINFVDEEISPRRAFATRYYNGEVPDVESDEGRSSMVSRDVRDVVQSIMPSIMRVFFSTDRVVEYAPTGPEDEEIAQQATDYANYVFAQENDGFNTFYVVAKDALIRKTGFMKAWWHESEEAHTQRYTGLDEPTVALLQSEADDFEVTQVTYEDAQQVDPMTGQPVTVQVPRFDVKVTKINKKGRIKITEVPPEEVIVGRRDRYLGETFVGHRKMMTVSDLVAMGYKQDEIEEYVTDEDFWASEEFLDRTNYKTYENTGSAMNEALRRCLYVEGYAKIDRNGDGIAELLKVCTIGSGYKVLAVEEVDFHPLVAFTVNPEPHLSPLEALSKADDLMDIQRLKTVVWRNSLDALAQSINPRTVVVEGRVEIQDVLNNEVGAVIRAKSPDAVIPLVTPDTSAQGLQMLGYVDEVKEARTGMSKAAVGLDPDALRSTAKNAANAVVSATQSQMELTARMLSNGFKDLFKLLLKIMTVHQDQAKTVRLRNKWVSIDPRTWSPNMDVSVSVALGSGTDEQKFNVLAGVAQKQEMILQNLGPNNPLVSLAQYSNTLSKMIELAGFKGTQQFVNRLPADFQMPPSPPPVDAQAQAAQMLAQVEREKAQAKMQVDAAKLQADQQIQSAKLQLEREKMQADFARKQLELELQAQKLQAEIRLKEAESVLKQLTTLRKGQENVASQQEESDAAEAKQEADEARQEGLLSQAIVALGSMIAQSQVATAQALNAPKRVLRDEMGRVTGVAPAESPESEEPPEGENEAPEGEKED